MTIAVNKSSWSLIDHEGRPVFEDDLLGQYSIVFFGFTNCKVICPRTLERLSRVLSNLGTALNQLHPYYITVDPGRDSPDAMKRFLSERAPTFTELTGTEEQIETVRKVFHVFANRKDDSDDPDGYDMPHTAFSYVVGPDGILLDHMSDAVDLEEMTKGLRKILASSTDAMPHRQALSPEPEQASSAKVSEAEMAGHGHESLTPMDHKQVGTIRHIGNLARQPKGDWSNMMGHTHLNDGFGAYRYQLSYAYYALALAHYHRLPAVPGVFKGTLERVITKMLEPDV